MPIETGDKTAKRKVGFMKNCSLYNSWIALLQDLYNSGAVFLYEDWCEKENYIQQIYNNHKKFWPKRLRQRLNNAMVTHCTVLKSTTFLSICNNLFRKSYPVIHWSILCHCSSGQKHQNHEFVENTIDLKLKILQY